MVSAADIQNTTQQAGVRLLGTVQVTGKVVQTPDYPNMPQINGATLHELTRPLIPTGFTGKVSFYVQVIEIIDPPQEPGAAA